MILKRDRTYKWTPINRFFLTVEELKKKKVEGVILYLSIKNMCKTKNFKEIRKFGRKKIDDLVLAIWRHTRISEPQNQSD